MGQSTSKPADNNHPSALLAKFIVVINHLLHNTKHFITQIPFIIVSAVSKLLPILFRTPRSRLIGVHALNILIRSLLPLSTASSLYMLYRLFSTQSAQISINDLPVAIKYIDYFILLWNPIEIIFFIYECYVANQLQTLSQPPVTTQDERNSIQYKLINAVHLLHDYTPINNDIAIGTDTSGNNTLNETLNSLDSESNAIQPHIHHTTNKIVQLSNGTQLMEREWDCRRYLTGWFLGCSVDDIYYENIADFLVTGSLNKKLIDCTDNEKSDIYQQTDCLIRGNLSFQRNDNYVTPGYNHSIKFICPPYDTIEWQHRPAIIYAGISAIHYGSEYVLRSMGYTKHCITIPADRSQQADVHINTDKELYFWHRKPVYSINHTNSTDDTIGIDDDVSEMPIVFCHGIGLGLTPYLSFIKQLPLCNTHSTTNNNRTSRLLEREIFLIEFEHVSMKRVHRIPSERETAHAVALMLSLPAGEKHSSHIHIRQVYKQQHNPQCRAAIFIGHSYGTLSLAWFVKYHPSMIGRLIFIDPICFLLFTHELSYKFFHRTPTSAFQTIMDYWVARELYIGNTLTRHMRWTESACFKEDLLTLRRHKCIPLTDDHTVSPGNIDSVGVPRLLRRDSTGDSFRVSEWNGESSKQPLLGHSHTDDDLHNIHSSKQVKTIVFLSEHDAIVGSQSVYTYLTTQIQSDVRSTDNEINVNWLNGFEHAQFLFNHEAQVRVCQAIVD